MPLHGEPGPLVADGGCAAARAELLHVLRLPDLDRVDRIGSFYGNPRLGRSPSS
jgi:hypothetical protein